METVPHCCKCACQSCGGHLEFEIRAIGEIVDCPHCGQKTKLAPLPDQTTKQSKSTSKRIRILISASLIVSVFLAVGIGHFSRPQNNAITDAKIANDALATKTTKAPVQTPPSNVPASDLSRSNNVAVVSTNFQTDPSAGLPDSNTLESIVESNETRIVEMNARRIAIERTSLDGWLSFVQRASTGRIIDNIQAAQTVAVVLGRATFDYPEPIEGDRMKVNQLLSYVQDKFSGINRLNPMCIKYNTQSHVWAIHDQNGGCIFSPVDLDPTSAQIISEPEVGGADMDGQHELTGRTRYSIRFTTINNQRRVILCGSNRLGIAGVELTDKVEVFCGFGPGDQIVKRVGTAMAGIIEAYGGKAEIVSQQ